MNLLVFIYEENKQSLDHLDELPDIVHQAEYDLIKWTNVKVENVNLDSFQWTFL